MEQNEKTQRLLKLIGAKADIEIEEIKPDMTWGELGIDSLDLMELVMEIEKEFFISIPDEDTHNFITVGDAINYIEKH